MVKQACIDLLAAKTEITGYKTIWVANSNQYEARLICLAGAMNQARITLFDHGGSNSIVSSPKLTAIRDLAAINELVLPTKSAAEQYKKINATPLSKSTFKADIIYSDGDPYYKNVSTTRVTRTNFTDLKSKRALYVTTVFRGIRQNLPTLLPDPLAFNLQVEMIKLLRQRKISVHVKPHPESTITPLQEHPLTEYANLDFRRFEEVLNTCDFYI